MFQKVFSFTGTLLLAGTTVLLLPALSQAQHGGGHGGGGHFGSGGGHFGGGGAHIAGAGGHMSGAHFGGYRSGMYHGGIRYGGSHYGSGRYRSYYGGSGYYPYYGLYGGYYPYYDEPYPYLSSSPMYDSGPSNTYGDGAAVFDSSTAPAALASANAPALSVPSTVTLEQDTAVHITVRAPADAQLWFNGTPTTSTGTVRQFDSPPLAAGKYGYDVQARWHEGGNEVTQTQHVAVVPGARLDVEFPVQLQAEEK